MGTHPIAGLEMRDMPANFLHDANDLVARDERELGHTKIIHLQTLGKSAMTSSRLAHKYC
eukprot:364804-Chlamydomonas_euryale.AAC.6